MANEVVNKILNQHDKSKQNSGNANANKGSGPDFSRYFNIMLPNGEKEGQKTIRVLPDPDGGTPFEEVHLHNFQMDDGSFRKFVCPKKTSGKDCPFCVAARSIRKQAETNDEKKTAKKYDPRQHYVVKVIHRDDPDKVKFWRFPHNSKGEGVFDKIAGIIKTKGVDVSDLEQGRDLTLNITKNEQGFFNISSIVDHDPSPLADNEEDRKFFTEDNEQIQWSDVYKVYPYDYLEIVVYGGIPVYDKEKGMYVDKNKQDGTKAEDHSSEEGDTSVEDFKVEPNTEGSENSEDSSEEEEGSDDLPF